MYESRSSSKVRKIIYHFPSIQDKCCLRLSFSDVPGIFLPFLSRLGKFDWKDVNTNTYIHISRGRGHNSSELSCFFRCLQATVGGIHPSQPPVIRISAIRAVYGYCEYLKEASNTQLLIPFLPNITEGLVTVATQFSSDVLSLCLETLSLVLSVSIFTNISSLFVALASVHLQFVHPSTIYIKQGSHKLWKSWKTWKITKKKFHALKNHGIRNNLNNHGKIMKFCEII